MQLEDDISFVVYVPPTPGNLIWFSTQVEDGLGRNVGYLSQRTIGMDERRGRFYVIFYSTSCDVSSFDGDKDGIDGEICVGTHTAWLLTRIAARPEEETHVGEEKRGREEKRIEEEEKKRF